MVMDMGRDAAQDESVVELTYQPTVGDLTQALWARLRASRAGRFQRWMPGIAAVLAALYAALALAGGDWEPLFFVWMLFLAVLAPLTPWLQARQFQRLAARQGTFRVAVSDAGLSVVTDTSTTTMNWLAMPRFAETRDVFVLLSGDNKAVGVTVLPKRGIQGPDGADRLRAVLDRHLTRV
ncbi:YcxB family protein [Streptomyces sp. 15-116A]|uniref:YcxB family protein n=1 Tax=Streptomyces sp. 15-116A TaxID=2259035 RepID=UPI0021B1AAC9|nr:YcxB family protein [Streptomyces sp. 15-116A]MCT7351401.1 YcxB family protein [Streptomyces sp. 15-116A]